jgi:hypothetical protein
MVASMTHLCLAVGAVGIGLIAIGLQPGPWYFGISEDDLRHPPTKGGAEWWSAEEVDLRAQREWLPARSWGRMRLWIGRRTAQWNRVVMPRDSSTLAG